MNLKGYLGELVLNFSWTDFKNTPVNLNIKNVLLLAVPRAETDVILINVNIFRHFIY